MQLQRQWTVRCTPQLRHLVANSGTTEGQCDILKNAIEKAVDSQMYPSIEASHSQEQYYIRSALHLCTHLMFSCCRGKSYIGIWIGDMSSWTLSNLCGFLCCCCCSYCLMLLLFICNCGSTTTDEQQQQNYTVTTTRIRTEKLNNLCRLIFLLLLLLFLLLLLCNFVFVHL